MKQKRFKEEQIIGALKEVDAGAKVDEVCRRLGISPVTFYRWRAKFGGMDVSEAKRLKALEDENRRLKTMVADLSLDNQALRSLLGKNGSARGVPPSRGRAPGGLQDVHPARLPSGRPRAFDRLLPKPSPGARGARREAQGARREEAALGLSAPPRPAATRGPPREP